MFHVQLLLLLFLLGSVAASVTVNWNSCPVTRSTAVSALVAADPEWITPSRLADTAQAGIRSLAEAGADNLRLLNFNIFPLLSCAQVEEGIWDFSLMDRVVVPFLEATLTTSNKSTAIVDIETSPLWMWKDGGACIKQSPTDPSCAWTRGQRTNRTCADASGTRLPPGPRRRCPHWGDAQVPRDPTYKELASYFARVAMWYTRGGFKDEAGLWHSSGHHFDESRIVWEIWNEVNHGREHNMTAQQYIKMYDAHVAALTTEMEDPATAVAPGGAWRGRFGGPSFGGLRSKGVHGFLENLLDPKSHTPENTPPDALTFHQYAVCDNTTAPGLEVIFQATRGQVSALQQLQALRDRLRPNAGLHLTESGIVCNAPRGCSGNDYACYYKTADFQRIYWVASAAQWLYQYLLSSEAADLATVAQSQILGYPAAFDGLSGEWPCGSMVDWTQAQLNHKYWIQMVLLRSVSRPFSFCATTVADASGTEASAPVYAQGTEALGPVYAQGLASAKGRVIVLINMRASTQTVRVPGATGKHALTIDSTVGNEPAREGTLTSDVIELKEFATMFIQWGQGHTS